jgi:uncharacterized protein YecT (DUF1311 family)
MVRWTGLCLLAGVLGAVGMSERAGADPIMECGVTTASQVELRACLDEQLEVTHRAMAQALSIARSQADELDRVTGADAAVLGLEASQQAWEAFRDVNCQLRSTLAAGGSGAGAFQRACEIAMTRARADELLRLISPGS